MGTLPRKVWIRLTLRTESYLQWVGTLRICPHSGLNEGNEKEGLMSANFTVPLIQAAEVELAFPLPIAMASQRDAFSAFARGEAVMGNRGVITNGDDASFTYVARSSPTAPTIVKFGSVTNANAALGLPAVHAYIAILNPVTGALDSFIDGESVTKIRTTAASMLAAQLLANPPKVIAVIGAGLQGIAHAKAAIELFAPEKLIFVTRTSNPELEKFLNDFSKSSTTDSAQEAASESDLIFVCTNSVTPVLSQSLKPGTTVVSIGSFSPNREEVAGKLVSESDLIVGDDAKTVITQNGSIIAALKANPELSSKIQSLGSLIDDSSLGRKSVDETIMYFSVGLGIQDAAIVEKYLEMKSK